MQEEAYQRKLAELEAQQRQAKEKLEDRIYSLKQHFALTRKLVSTEKDALVRLVEEYVDIGDWSKDRLGIRVMYQLPAVPLKPYDVIPENDWWEFMHVILETAFRGQELQDKFLAIKQAMRSEEYFEKFRMIKYAEEMPGWFESSQSGFNTLEDGKSIIGYTSFMGWFNEELGRIEDWLGTRGKWPKFANLGVLPSNVNVGGWDPSIKKSIDIAKMGDKLLGKRPFDSFPETRKIDSFGTQMDNQLEYLLNQVENVIYNKSGDPNFWNGKIETKKKTWDMWINPTVKYYQDSMKIPTQDLRVTPENALITALEINQQTNFISWDQLPLCQMVVKLDRNIDFQSNRISLWLKCRFKNRMGVKESRHFIDLVNKGKLIFEDFGIAKLFLTVTNATETVGLEEKNKEKLQHIRSNSMWLGDQNTQSENFVNLRDFISTGVIPDVIPTGPAPTNAREVIEEGGQIENAGDEGTMLTENPENPTTGTTTTSGRDNLTKLTQELQKQRENLLNYKGYVQRWAKILDYFMSVPKGVTIEKLVADSGFRQMSNTVTNLFLNKQTKDVPEIIAELLERGKVEYQSYQKLYIEAKSSIVSIVEAINNAREILNDDFTDSKLFFYIKLRVFSTNTANLRFSWGTKYGFWDSVYKFMPKLKMSKNLWGDLLHYEKYSEKVAEHIKSEMTKYAAMSPLAISGFGLSADTSEQLAVFATNIDRVGVKYFENSDEMVKTLIALRTAQTWFYGKKLDLTETSKRRITRFLEKDSRDLKKIGHFFGTEFNYKK